MLNSFNVIYTCSIQDLNKPRVILVLTAHGQMHRLIPHADAVELAFVFIYMQVANALMCLMTYFTGSSEPSWLDTGLRTKIKYACLFDYIIYVTNYHQFNLI